MIYLLHGEDELRRREAVKALLPAPGSDEYAGVSTFEGLAEPRSVIEACSALPFLADRRYVLLRNFIGANSRRGKRGSEDGEEAGEDQPQQGGGKRPVQMLREYLPNLPETTTLIFEESGKVAVSSIIYKYVKAHGEERESRPLQGAELSAWIRAAFERRQARVHPLAVQTLIAYVGADLLLLEKEIEKLAAYAGDEVVQKGDVTEMVASAEETKVWDMIDAALLGRSDEAVARLRLLLMDSANPPLRTLGAIVNRVRTMLLIKELVDQRLPDAVVAQRSGMPDWSVRSARPLARRLTLGQIQLIYERLLATDLALKSSPLSEKLVLELLVLDIARGEFALPRTSISEAAREPV